MHAIAPQKSRLRDALESVLFLLIVGASALCLSEASEAITAEASGGITSFVCYNETDTGCFFTEDNSSISFVEFNYYKGEYDDKTEFLSNAGGTFNSFSKTIYPYTFWIEAKTATSTYNYQILVNGSSSVSFAPYQSNIQNTLNTRFSGIQITGTSTINITTQYFLDPNEINNQIAQFNPTGVKYEYSKRPGTTSENQIDTIPYGTLNNGTSTINIQDLADGTYDVNITFYNFSNSFNGTERPFPKAYIYTSFTISGGILTATGTIEFYNALTEPPKNIYQECSITAIGGCISNAFIYLFVPEAYSTNEIFTARDSLQNKAPFVYLYQVPQLWETLYTTTQTSSMSIGVTTTIGHIDFISESQLDAIPLTNTIRTIVGYLLWVMLALLIYTETKRIFNHQPTT